MDLTSDRAAGLLHIAGAALRQIELGLKPASDRLIARAARLYRIDKAELMKQEPAKEPKPKPPAPKIEPTAPPRRSGKEGERTAPRRASGQRAGAA